MQLKTTLTFRERRVLAKSNDRRVRVAGPNNQVRGTACSYAVLTEDIVRRMRALKRPGVGVKKIVRLLAQEGLDLSGFCELTLLSALTGKTWNHVR